MLLPPLLILGKICYMIFLMLLLQIMFAMVIFFDFGTAGDDSIYYYDDIELVGTLQDLSFQDFEGTAPTFTVFGNIADTEVVANPDTHLGLMRRRMLLN